jgi:uncharacterized protein YkwD
MPEVGHSTDATWQIPDSDLQLWAGGVGARTIVKPCKKDRSTLYLKCTIVLNDHRRVLIESRNTPQIQDGVMRRCSIGRNMLLLTTGLACYLATAIPLSATDQEAIPVDAAVALDRVQTAHGTSTLSPDVNCSALLTLPICRLQLEIDAVNRINKHRADSGRAPLIWDNRLFVGTRCHSTDMAINNCFQHDDCDGTSWVTRYGVLGYSGLHGQDLANGFTSGTAVADAWLAAGGLHAQIMLDPTATHIAVGYAGPSGPYWTVAYGGETTAQTLPCCCVNRTGNVDCDPTDAVDISDLSALIDNLYISFTPLCCKGEANVDGSVDGNIDISDLSALIDYLYISFTLPAACQ